MRRLTLSPRRIQCIGWNSTEGEGLATFFLAPEISWSVLSPVADLGRLSVWFCVVSSNTQ